MPPQLAVCQHVTSRQAQLAAEVGRIQGQARVPAAAARPCSAAATTHFRLCKVCRHPRRSCSHSQRRVIPASCRQQQESEDESVWDADGSEDSSELQVCCRLPVLASASDLCSHLTARFESHPLSVQRMLLPVQSPADACTSMPAKAARCSAGLPQAAVHASGAGPHRPAVAHNARPPQGISGRVRRLPGPQVLLDCNCRNAHAQAHVQLCLKAYREGYGNCLVPRCSLTATASYCTCPGQAAQAHVQLCLKAYREEYGDCLVPRCPCSAAVPACT